MLSFRQAAALLQKAVDLKAPPISLAQLHGFLVRFRFVDFDFGDEDAQAYRATIAVIRSTFDIEVGIAQDLLRALGDILEEQTAIAGRLSAPALLAKLRERLPNLPGPRQLRLTTDKLLSYSSAVMSDIETDLDGIHLERDAVEKAARLIDSSDVCIIFGGPGRGKSAVLKALYNNQRQRGPTLVLSARRLAGITGWHGLANTIGLDTDLRTVASVLESNAAGATFFIDGLSELTEDGSRLAANDLLAGLQQHTPRVKVVMTCRSAVPPTWLTLSSTGSVATIEIPALSDDELRYIARQRPQLFPIILRANVSAFLRTIYALRVVLDQRSAVRLPSVGPISELDVAASWWDGIVGSGPFGQTKRQTLLQIADELFRGRSRYFLATTLDSDALSELLADAIISRDARRDVYFFRHDLLEDWSLYRTIDRQLTGISHTLQFAGDLSSVRRPTVLAAQALIEDGARLVVFFDEYSRGEAAKAPWASAFPHALVTSTKLPSLMPTIIDRLLSNDGWMLKAMLLAIRTEEVDPNHRVGRKPTTDIHIAGASASRIRGSGSSHFCLAFVPHGAPSDTPSCAALC